MTWDSIQQVLRILMQVAAGYLVKDGLFTEDMWTTFSGAAISLAGVAWWFFWDRKRTA